MGRRPSCLCGSCKNCKSRAKSRAWYYRNKETVLSRLRERRESGELAQYEKDRYHNNQDFHAKKKARNMVGARVANGTIIPQPCEKCGALPSEAHHDDYSKPLEIRWLCQTHHLAHHHPEIYAPSYI